MDFDSARRCYLRGTAMKALWNDPKVLDALVDQLEVPGKPATLKRLSDDEKRKAIEGQIEHFRRTRTSRWYDVAPLEILAASIYAAEKMPRAIINEHFF